MRLDTLILNTSEAAKHVGLAKATLDAWRCNGKTDGPPYIRMGKAIRYSRTALDLWMAEHTVSAEPR